MAARGTIPVTFVPHPDALEALAVIGVGPAARALGARLLAESDERLRKLRGVAGRGALVVLGPSDELPWADGVHYLGRHSSAPSLLLPTTLRPDVPLEVFEQAVLEREPRLLSPVCVIAAPPRLISVNDALPIERDKLRGWLEGES
jgi:hypothetical protein